MKKIIHCDCGTSFDPETESNPLGIWKKTKF